MDEVLSLVYKWLVPIVCSGLVALILTPIWNKYHAGDKAEQQRKWDEHARHMQEQFQTFKSEAEEKDSSLEQQITDIKDSMTLIAASIESIKSAMLQSHLKSLMIDSKMYIQRGYITVEELDDYNERYLIYKSLGGNGHMTPWAEKIRKLPNKPS